MEKPKYEVNERDSNLELFTLYVLDGEIIRPEFVWAESLDEAIKLTEENYEIIDESSLE